MGGSSTQPDRFLLTFLLVVLSVSVAGNTAGSDGCWHAAVSPAGMFVFGSSLVDNGNNNFLQDPGVRADYHPYGIDFPTGPSGRFCNGKSMVDALGEHLKLPGRIPPVLGPRTKGSNILHGVNYASGGSGILNETRPTRGEVISLDQQISIFEKTTLPQLGAQLAKHGRTLSAELPKYLFLVGTGGNDYLLNYFQRRPPLSVQEFTASLITTLISQLKRLHSLGARKFVLVTVQPIGCVPVVRERLQVPDGTCVEAINGAALVFNRNLTTLVVDQLRQQMPGSHLVSINSYEITSSILHTPAPRGGFTETMKACCKTSSDGVLCERGGRVCDDRDSYVFFDGLHPTEAVNELIAQKAYASEEENDVYPINVKQLAALKV